MKLNMRNIRIAVILLTGLLVAIIVFQNREPVTTHVLFATFKMPRAALLLVTAALGFLAGAVVALHYTRKRG